MQTHVVKGENRKPSGRHANERLRRRGMVPAVIYGHGEAPQAVALSQHDLSLALEHGSHVVKVVVDDGEKQYLLQEVQYDHLGIAPLHVDLMRVSETEIVTIKIPIELRGEAKGVVAGGEVNHVITDLEVQCTVLNIPSGLRVDISKLAMGEHLTVADLKLPEGVTATHDDADVVVAISAKRAEEEAEAVEGEAAGEGTGAEPEVIGRSGKDEGSEGEA